MGHIGIIAEYNPFHNGHFYQIHKAKELYPDKEIMIIMSGNYVQRGEPAIIHKQLRTKMALAAGADLVLELPSIFSCNSAEYFARAAIFNLYYSGCIDTLLFGAECDNFNLLNQLADILVHEPETISNSIKQYLQEGLSYPKARSLSLCNYLNDSSLSEVLNKPNNILAIEYLKVIKANNLPINPVLIQRTEDNYHSDALQEYQNNWGSINNICSATALRQNIDNPNVDFSNYIPAKSYEYFKNDKFAKPIYLKDFYPFIQEKIRNTSDLSIYQDINQDFSNRLKNYTIFPYEFDTFLNEIQSKNITNTRVNRCLLNILLEHKKEMVQEFSNIDFCPYLKLLGFQASSCLPKLLKTNCQKPVLTKIANYKKLLDSYGIQLLEQEQKNDIYYRQIFYNKYKLLIPSDFETSTIIYYAEE